MNRMEMVTVDTEKEAVEVIHIVPDRDHHLQNAEEADEMGAIDKKSLNFVA
jgi:hypothetical protein